MHTDDQTLSQLAAQLQHPDWAERFHAALKLGQLGSAARPAVPGLVATLTDAAAPVRTMAIVTLGHIGADAREAVSALSDVLLEDQEPSLRGRAAAALGQIGGEEATTALEDAYAADEDEEVREAIAHALAEIDARSLDAAA